MKSSKLAVFACLSLVAALLAACGALSTLHPIQNVEGAAVPRPAGGGSLSMQQVERAIIGAATYKRWQAKRLDEGTIEASITVRGRHSAVVHIDYSPSSYSIRLVSSVGLEQAGGMIHRNYNKWIILLDQQIQDRLYQAGS